MADFRASLAPVPWSSRGQLRRLASFSAFWYRLDRTSTASPQNAKAEWTRTTAKQILVDKDWRGEPISNFAYYLHVVSEDTQGRLTKTASTYRIQMGAEPPKVRFYGYVRNAASAGIAGAQIRLEPYGLTTTTDTSGNFMFQSVYQGNYVVSIAASGYSPLSQQLAVDGSSKDWAVTLAP